MSLSRNSWAASPQVQFHRESAGNFDVAGRFANFALHLLGDDDDETRILSSIVAGAVELIPGAVAAAVLTVSQPRELQARAVVGDALPEAALRLQNELGDGPCLQAIGSGLQILVADLTEETRWPQFVDGLRDAGGASMLCTPLIADNRVLGVLSLIGDARPHQFDDGARVLAGVFAAHAGIAMAGARRRNSINSALANRDVIGQAKGILMERFRYTPDEAFAVLINASSKTNTKLRTVCDDFCRTGELPAPPPRRTAKVLSAVGGRS